MDIVGALLDTQQRTRNTLYTYNKYTQVLNTLTSLQGPIDDFFQHVMVMCDDNHIKDNRLALLFKLRSLFLLVADISKLQI